MTSTTLGAGISRQKRGGDCLLRSLIIPSTRRIFSRNRHKGRHSAVFLGANLRKRATPADVYYSYDEILLILDRETLMRSHKAMFFSAGKVHRVVRWKRAKDRQFMSRSARRRRCITTWNSTLLFPRENRRYRCTFPCIVLPRALKRKRLSRFLDSHVPAPHVIFRFCLTLRGVVTTRRNRLFEKWRRSTFCNYLVVIRYATLCSRAYLLCRHVVEISYVMFISWGKLSRIIAELMHEKYGELKCSMVQWGIYFVESTKLSFGYEQTNVLIDWTDWKIWLSKISLTHTFLRRESRKEIKCRKIYRSHKAVKIRSRSPDVIAFWMSSSCSLKIIWYQIRFDQGSCSC